jgi:hypothetical protein
MNLRYYINHSTTIARLAEQAHEHSNTVYDERLKTERADAVIFFDIFNQKFAELIVRECSKIANAGIDPDDNYLIGDDILKHFGVEE